MGVNINNLIKIETYWNVNQIKYAALFVQSRIKIETYWNVNRIDLYCLD